MNKKGIQIQNYLLIIVFLLSQYYFTFFKPDINARSLILSVSYLFLSFQIAWLMLIRVPLKMRKITEGVGFVFCILFIIQVGRIILINFLQQKNLNYFNLGNSEALFIFSYQIILIMLAYSISLMYTKRLIRDVVGQEKEILRLSAEKIQLELNLKKKELTQKELNIASLREVNKNIIFELKNNLDNLSEKKNSDIHNFIRSLNNFPYKSKIWEEFDVRFKEVNSYFYTKLLTDYPMLSVNEIRVACLLSQNYNTKELAEILHRSTKTIENIRGILRKKMNLHKNENLTMFLYSLK
ncbi:hypothetical protein [Lutibacter sp.]|uniref:helix-turn-helix transcriptional regulator n=1 Tax=Lutibacter sp. TaxID=1925666 RepID=UPI0025B98793|nr:hypothetical protein [Lutibacter sp.]MCF6182373.1 hypothetical protein [Lutibacter sp.]